MSDKNKLSEQAAARWEQVYKDNPLSSLPWEEGAPSPQLVELVESSGVKQGRVLDICTGSGNNAIYLAGKGFACSGIDISATAIEYAREKSAKAGVTCDFKVGDALALPFPANTFDLVFDRGCFHSMAPGQRDAFIKGINSVLKDKGKYQMICFSKKSRRWAGPPYSFSPGDIKKLFTPLFDILFIKEISDNGQDFFLSALMGKKAAEL